MTAVKRPVRSPKNKPATGRTKWHLHTKNLTQGFKKTLLPSKIIALQLSQREIESALSFLCSQPTAAARQLGLGRSTVYREISRTGIERAP
jgi:transcriptional regulator of acetoin/glycerol metabolism